MVEVSGGEMNWNEDGEPVDSEGNIIEHYTQCDCREHPDSVVDGINDLLEAHELELVSYETGGDFYLFGLRAKTT